MKCKFSLLLLLCGLFLVGQAQSSALQELLNRKQFAAVIAYTDSLSPADSADYGIMSVVGQAYEGILKYKEAYCCYQHCLKMDTTNIDALNTVARAAFNFGRTTEAKRYFLKVLEVDSLNFYANHQLARLNYQLGDYGKAIEYYQVLSGTEGENPTIITGLADCFVMKRTAPATLTAVALYSRAFELNPENARLASTLVNVLLSINESKEAISVCDTGLFYNPGNPLLRHNKGMACYMAKNYLLADTLYSGLLAEGDSSFITMKYAGASRYMAGYPMNAIEPLEWAYEEDSTDVETALLLGAALGKTYDRKRAYQLFDQAEENMKPKKFLLNLLLTFRGETLSRDGRRLEAQKLYYEAWKNDPTRLDLLYKIENDYPNWDRHYKEEEEKQRGLFIKNLYLNAYIKSGKSLKGYYYYRPFLESMYEDAFFRSLTELPMLAPDGKKSKLSVIDLRSLINRIPEMTEEEKARQEKGMAAMRKYEEEQRKKQEETKKKNIDTRTSDSGDIEQK